MIEFDDLKNLKSPDGKTNCNLRSPVLPSPELISENIENTFSSLDLSSEDAIKAYVANRIKKCTQRVLNKSLSTDIPTSFNPYSEVNKENKNIGRSLPQLPKSYSVDTEKVIPLKLSFSSLANESSISEISPLYSNSKFPDNESIGTFWSEGSSDLNKGCLFSESRIKGSTVLEEAPLSDNVSRNTFLFYCFICMLQFSLV